MWSLNIVTMSEQFTTFKKILAILRLETWVASFQGKCERIGKTARVLPGAFILDLITRKPQWGKYCPHLITENLRSEVKWHKQSQARRLSHQHLKQGFSSKAHPLFTLHQPGWAEVPSPSEHELAKHWKVTQSIHRHKTLAATGTFECPLNILWFWGIIPFPRTSKVQAHYMPYIFQKT